MASINVSLNSEGTGLEMTSNGNASTNKNTPVTWVVNDANIASITIFVAPSTGQSNIWSTEPHNLGSESNPNKNWQGTVGNFPDKSEDYNISFTLTNGSTGSHDPRISVNPK